jgi:hypothetical protein
MAPVTMGAQAVFGVVVVVWTHPTNATSRQTGYAIVLASKDIGNQASCEEYLVK